MQGLPVSLIHNQSHFEPKWHIYPVFMQFEKSLTSLVNPEFAVAICCGL
jgi:hypothetical protein